MQINYDQFADIYDVDMGRNIGDADVQFYLDKCDGRSPIVELGCGTGRIMEPFVRHGLRIVGLDISRDMIRRASGRLSRFDPSLFKIVHADMTNFQLPERFDYAVCAFSTYSKLLTFAQQRAFFRCIREHLNTSAVFALDMFLQTRDFDRIPDGKLIPDYERRWDDSRQCWVSRSKRVWKNIVPSVNKIELVYTFTTPEPDSRTITKVLYDYTRYSTKEELKQRFLEGGFELCEIYGGYDGAPFGHRSKQMIFVVRKKP